MLVYLIRNKLNGKVYVGKTSKDLAVRWKEHLSCRNRIDQKRSHLYAAMRKYGPENFEIQPIVEALTSAELNRLEQLYIQTFNSRDNRSGYNRSSGGDGGPLFGGHRHSEAAKEKMRIKRRGRKPYLGHSHSDKSKRKTSDSIRTRLQNEPRLRKANGTFS
jgi:group I intron endonuclease